MLVVFDLGSLLVFDLDSKFSILPWVFDLRLVCGLGLGFGSGQVVLDLCVCFRSWSGF